jgi:protein O-mannosyl-transferase
MQKNKTKQPENLSAKPSSLVGKGKQTIQQWFPHILFVFAVLLYIQTIGFDYTLDDTMMFTQNEFTKQGISAIPKIFSQDAFTGFYGGSDNMIAGGRYRPFTHAMFAVEYSMFGENPLPGHLINVLLYALLGIVVFKTLTLMFSNSGNKNKWISYIPFTATLLFLAHPLHTEVVANIKGRDEIISMGGSMLALLFSLKYIQNSNTRYLIYSFFCFLAALFSKENALPFIAVIPLAMYFFTEAKRSHYLKTMLPLLTAAIIFMLARYNALGFWLTGNITETEILNNPFLHSSKTHEIATVFFTWLIYFKLLIFPHPLTHDYYPWHLNILKFSDPQVIVAVIVVAVLLFFAVTLFRKKHFVSFGILFFAATFSIQSNLLFNLGTFMNERFVFASLLGFCIIAAGFLSKFSLNHARNMKILLVATLVLYSAKTISRSTAWKDNYTLFTTDVRTSANSAKCNASAAEMMIVRGKTTENKVEAAKLFRQALKHLLHAIELHPAYFAAYDLAGMATFHLEDYRTSFNYYKACHTMLPTSVQAVTNMKLAADAAFQTGKQQQGIELMKELIAIAPDSLVYVSALGDMYVGTGNTSEAVQLFEGILAQQPEYAPAWSKLGEIYAIHFQDFANAEPLLLRAFELNPDDLTVNDMLGIVSLMLLKYEQSLKHYQIALNLAPGQARIHTNIARTYQLMGNPEMAQFHMQKAAELEKQNDGIMIQ